MRRFERGGIRESIDRVVASIARAYGFTASPVPLAKSNDSDHTFLIAALAGSMGEEEQNTRAWGVRRAKGSSHIVFAIANPKHAIAQAFVIKASLATAESAGFSECRVLITSVGDADSRRRYLRELTAFFKKHAREVPDHVRDEAVHDPDHAARMLIEASHALKDMLPRTIDFLSEPSRKVMLETVTLLEALGIPYLIEPRLPFTPDVNRELVFAIEGENEKGNRVSVASGGRFQAHTKDAPAIIGMSIEVPETIDVRTLADAPAPLCFVVHVGEAARLKAFALLDSLWRSHIELHHALLALGVDEQMKLAQQSGARFVAIVGQREALDGTVIVKNLATQLQETLPLDRALTKLSRAR